MSDITTQPSQQDPSLKSYKTLLAENTQLASSPLQDPSRKTNEYAIHCPRCKSKVVGKGVACWPPALPIFVTDSSHSSTPPHLWLITDMMAFDNVGFSRPAPGTSDLRYLSCADCELGPIGVHDPDMKDKDGKKLFLLAVDRVRYRVV
ncbi:Mss4-like protein [Blyttiomyces helicus]|uniref:Mss4-like protein n=1 Tax=Blyttiomyces helicus TaxID=388810 RepID=A0A4P9WTC3_9FUNG|nr:Mss4-like protein [Blyttiomyces helicus]|eukprot:RKO94306.1 Mss4-like protein [Blyttiomyces helicus]